MLVNIEEFVAVRCFEKSIGSHNITEQELLPGKFVVDNTKEESTELVEMELQDKVVNVGNSGGLNNVDSEQFSDTKIEPLQANLTNDESLGVPGPWVDVDVNDKEQVEEGTKNKQKNDEISSETSEEWEPKQLPLPAWATTPINNNSNNGNDGITNPEAYARGVKEGRELAEDKGVKKQKL